MYLSIYLFIIIIIYLSIYLLLLSYYLISFRLSSLPRLSMPLTKFSFTSLPTIFPISYLSFLFLSEFLPLIFSPISLSIFLLLLHLPLCSIYLTPSFIFSIHLSLCLFVTLPSCPSLSLSLSLFFLSVDLFLGCHFDLPVGVNSKKSNDIVSYVVEPKNRASANDTSTLPDRQD